MRICPLEEDQSARRVGERLWVGILLEVSQDLARRGEPVFGDIGEDLRDRLVPLGTRLKRFECVDVKTVVLAVATKISNNSSASAVRARPTTAASAALSSQLSIAAMIAFFA